MKISSDAEQVIGLKMLYSLTGLLLFSYVQTNKLGGKDATCLTVSTVPFF